LKNSVLLKYTWMMILYIISSSKTFSYRRKFLWYL